MDLTDLQRRFSFHPDSRETNADEHAAVREGCMRLAVLLNDQIPDGSAKSLAITHLEDAMFWANAGIARWMP